ncbi:MAG: Holliday junction branch migration protein RuvA [bacterium]|nr:Holliday junction branch migration protein RuvA [bacterium]MCY3925417.1 Holliday junction branch migration protein RuvA [bacterium]
MIGSLRGRVLDRLLDELLVEVGGVGYRVTVGDSALRAAGSVGTEVLLYVHHHVREDAETLYGFGSLVELRCFEAMLGANRVGPSLALAILGVHDPAALQRLLAAGDIDALCLVPGVGAKTAQRLLVELQARLGVADFAATAAGVGPSGDGVHSDLRAALGQLGYRDDEVSRAVAGMPADGDVSELLREALRQLTGTRQR